MFILSEAGIVYNTDQVKKLEVIQDEVSRTWGIMARTSIPPHNVMISSGYMMEGQAWYALEKLLKKNLINGDIEDRR